MLGDDLLGVGPGAVGVGVVAGPEDVLGADQVAGGQAGDVLHEGGAHVAAEVGAGGRVGGEAVGAAQEAVALEGVVQALHEVGDPADVVLDREGDQVRVALEDAAEDHRPQGALGEPG